MYTNCDTYEFCAFKELPKIMIYHKNENMEKTERKFQL